MPIADVKLFVSNLEAVDEALIFSALSFITKAFTKVATTKHWAVIVQFRNDTNVFLCEILRNRNSTERGRFSGFSGLSSSSGFSRINWMCERMPEEEVIRGKSGICIHPLGCVEITPERLRSFCSEIVLNNCRYNLFNRNCQDWVKELLRKLGLYPLPSNVHSISDLGALLLGA